jgi:hypothetical protein
MLEGTVETSSELTSRAFAPLSIGVEFSAMIDEIEKRVLDDIAKFGWHLIQVNADDQGPSFVYSIGMMETLRHPEMIMFGLAPKLMATVINDAGRQIGAGRNFAEFGLFEDLLEGYACKFVSVQVRWHERYLGYAMWHRRSVGKIGTLTAIQCLWPDKAGRFPDEEGCADAVVAGQPLLDR